MSQTKAPPHLITLILLAGISPLALNMFLPSLANIAAEFETDYATVSWAVSGYLAITAGIQLIVGPLSDRIGRRPVLLLALATFSAASVGCVMAQNIETFLMFRMLQGGMTAGYTLSMAIVRDTKSEREAISLIGYIGMSMAVAPMLGPMLGGVLDTVFGWRATFIFYAMAGFFLLVMCWIDLGETRQRQEVAAGTKPLRAGALLREPLFWAYALCGAFSVGAFYIFLTGVPLVAASTFGVSTAELGFFIGTITIGFMLGGFLTGRYGARYRVSTTMILGRVIACGGLSLGLLLFSLGFTSPAVFFASTICVGLGNGFTMPGSNTGVMSVRPSLAGSAAGLMGAMIVGLGAMVTAGTGMVMTAYPGPRTLLVMMLVSSAIGLALAVLAARLAGRNAGASG
ncbi:MAG: multidrug effflux MFS transporter [Sulfitobacter sp.]